MQATQPSRTEHTMFSLICYWRTSRTLRKHVSMSECFFRVGKTYFVSWWPNLTRETMFPVWQNWNQWGIMQTLLMLLKTCFLVLPGLYTQEYNRSATKKEAKQVTQGNQHPRGKLVVFYEIKAARINDPKKSSRHDTTIVADPST